MRLLVTLLALFCMPWLIAQTKFFRTYGGGYYDAGYGVVETPDKGYLAVGSTSSVSADVTDVLLLKTDSAGVFEFYKYPILPGAQQANDIISAHQGNGYILTGFSSSFETGYDLFICKTDLNGDTLWFKTFGGFDWDAGYALDTTSDGHYMVVGETYSFGAGNADVWVLKFDENGDTLWSKTFGGAGNDYARDIQFDTDSLVGIVGATYSFGNGGADVYVIRINLNGDTLFTRAYGSIHDEIGTSISNYFDGTLTLNYLIGLERTIDNFPTKGSLMRVSKTGNFVNQLDYGFDDGNEIVASFKARPYDQVRRFIFSYAENSPGLGQYSVNLQITSQGGFSGNKIVYNQNGDQFPRNLTRTSDGGILVVGETSILGPGQSALFLLKTDSIGGTASSLILDAPDDPATYFQMYPNPVATHLYIANLPQNMQVNATFWNMQGQQMLSTVISISDIIDVSSWSSGMYVVQLKMEGGQTIQKRFVKQ